MMGFLLIGNLRAPLVGVEKVEEELEVDRVVVMELDNAGCGFLGTCENELETYRGSLP
jgi:hypothetical protein